MGCAISIAKEEAPAESAYTKRYCRVIEQYLPHFAFDTPSTKADHTVAFDHWNAVYKDTIHSPQAQPDAPVEQLFQSFYAYLFEHSPQLEPLFKSSRHVQSKVLVHITAGIKALLGSEDRVHKVVHLAMFHVRMGVKPQDFDPLGQAFIHGMKSTSGADWSEKIETAWRRIFCHAAILVLVNIPYSDLNLTEYD
ncbi:hypothetical protein PINS_up003781 [Pythium insidiosum]|nr:hypothetical protein PINS_up003781 [Pythium insidiosum]